MKKRLIYALAAFLMLAANFAGPVQVFAEELGAEAEVEVTSENVVGGGAESVEGDEGTSEADAAESEVLPEGADEAEAATDEAADENEMVAGEKEVKNSTNVSVSSFEGLLEAFDATWEEDAGTMNIRLEADIAQTYGDEDYLFVNQNWTVTLDLNGHILTLRNDGTRGILNYGTLVVTGNGTITNSTDETMNESYGLIDNYGGTVIIKNGTYVDWGQGGGAALKNRTVSFDGGTTWAQGTLTIEAATITAYATAGGNACVYSDGVLTVADGVEMRNYATDEVHNGYFGSYALTVSSGTATIGATVKGNNPVKVTSGRGALAVNSGTVVVNNGVYTGETWYGMWITNDNNITDVTINYGEFTGGSVGKNGLRASVDDGKQDVSDATIVVKDGKFKGYNDNAAAVAVNKSGSAHSWGMEISGGWYSTEPDESYIADGYTTYEIDNGYLVAPEFNGLVSQYILSATQKGFDMHAWLSNLPEGSSYVVEDANVAKVVVEQYADEGVVFYQSRLQGVSAGTTKVKVMYGDYVLDEAQVKVFDIKTNLRSAQEVGTSQTFYFETSEGFEVLGAFAFSEEDGSVVFTDNGDGTYTLTVNAFPMNTYSDGETEIDAIVEVMVGVADTDEVFITTVEYPVVLYAMAAEDAAGEAVSAAETTTNESVMRNYVAEVVEKVFEQYVADMSLLEGGMTVMLDDGTVVEVSDAWGLMEALAMGETIEAVLTEPAALDENGLDAGVASAMRGVMGDGKTGHRFVDISVELRAGDNVVGYITELGSALKVSMDVSADGTPAAGYTRIYHVVRYHNGVAEEIEGVEYDPATGVIKFASDKFSTYLVAYEDVLSATADTGVFVGEGGSAAANGVLAAMVAVVALTVAGAVKLAKTRK